MLTTDITEEIKTRVRRANRGHTTLAAEHIYLLVAVVAGIVALAVWWDGPHDNINGAIFDVLRIVAAVAFCGFIIRDAEARTRHANARHLADTERARREGYAEGFVDGAARRTPSDPGHLRVAGRVN
jgi:hypothetical protein